MKLFQTEEVISPLTEEEKKIWCITERYSMMHITDILQLGIKTIFSGTYIQCQEYLNSKTIKPEIKPVDDNKFSFAENGEFSPITTLWWLLNQIKDPLIILELVLEELTDKEDEIKITKHEVICNKKFKSDVKNREFIVKKLNEISIYLEENFNVSRWKRK